MAELSSAGSVLPIAWNMPEQAKTMPRPKKFHDTTRRIVTPASTACGSDVNQPTGIGAQSWQATTTPAMTTISSVSACFSVSTTRSGRRAPKFWPATAGIANEIAIEGIASACITRPAMPKPACAAAPKSRMRA